MEWMPTHPIRYPSDLRDEEWEYIRSLVPAPKSGEGKRGRPLNLDRRSLVNAIFYIVRSGCAWRMLPRDFGPWQTVYGYYRRWYQDWTWRFIHDAVRDWLRKTEKDKVAPTAAIIDSPSVKVGDQRGERGYDAGRKVSGRKRRVAVDTLGLMLVEGHDEFGVGILGPNVKALDKLRGFPVQFLGDFLPQFAPAFGLLLHFHGFEHDALGLQMGGQRLARGAGRDCGAGRTGFSVAASVAVVFNASSPASSSSSCLGSRLSFFVPPK